MIGQYINACSRFVWGRLGPLVTAGLIAVVFTVSTAVPASAMICNQPHAPQPPFSKPRVPHCLNSIGNQQQCRDGEIEQFGRAVERYTRELSRYIDKSEEFARKASQYAQCELENLIP